MFAKLSALALCLAFVSALQIQVEDVGKGNTTVTAYFIVSEGDPTNFDLILSSVNSTHKVVNDLDVTSSSTLVVAMDSQPDPKYSLYQLIATKVGNASVEYVRSNEFTFY